ncbi:MAG TPA: hypothetical protein VLF18_03980 [Tahibacter sp.]|uniref:hypothetical protein n=1 Tax=Tahibacter sp. TaxID=2056211 RepID=UPI002C000E05|nr:hypothetical protein [Tahibacter sp.]HSX59341.1 hypothetical protein [Tahibacter sp.]
MDLDANTSPPPGIDIADACVRREPAPEAYDAQGQKCGIHVRGEPTTGLHLADVEQRLALLDRLVNAGKAAVVIEHPQAVIAHADWIIDPERAQGMTADAPCSRARRPNSRRSARRLPESIWRFTSAAGSGRAFPSGLRRQAQACTSGAALRGEKKRCCARDTKGEPIVAASVLVTLRQTPRIDAFFDNDAFFENHEC